MTLSRWTTRLRWPLLLAFPIFGLISTFWSPYPWESIGAGGVLLIVSIIIGVLTLWSPTLLSIFLKLGNAGMVLLVLIIFMATLLFAVESGGGRFHAPFFVGSGAGGATAALATLGALALATKIRKRTYFPILLLVGLLGALTVAFSGTRLAAVALVAGTLAFYLLDRTSQRLAVGVSVALGLSLGSMAPVATSFLRPQETSSVGLGRFTTRAFGDAGDDVSSGRLEIWGKKFAEIQDSFAFGSGFDSSQKMDGFMAHNQFLTVTEEVGILGLVLFVAFLVAVLSYLIPGLTRNPYLPALIGSMTLLMGDSFLFGWRNPNSIMTWAILFLAVVYAVLGSKYVEQEPLRPSETNAR